MSVRVTASPTAIDQTSVVGVLKRSAPKVIVASALIAGLAFAVLSLAAPRYQSKAELSIMAGAAGADPETHVRGLQAPDLLGRVADELKLKARPEFNASLGAVDTLDALLRSIGVYEPRRGASEHDMVLRAMHAALDVSMTGERRFAVRFTSHDAGLAADAANTIADAYARALASAGRQGPEAQHAALDRNVSALSHSLEVDQALIVRQRNEIEAAAEAGGVSIDERLATLSSELAASKAIRAAADEQARLARDLTKTGASVKLADAEIFPVIHDLVQQRARAERQLAELTAMLNPAHPRVRQLDADLGRLKKRIATEVRKLAEGLEAVAKTGAVREGEAQTSYDDFKNRVDALAPERERLLGLEAATLKKQADLKALRGRLAESREVIAKLVATPVATIVSRAQPPKVALPTKTVPITGLMFLATFLLGTALAVTKALVNAARGDAPSVSRAKSVGTVSSAVVTPVQGNGNNEISISAVADRLQRARMPQGGHRTLVTAALPDGIDAGVEAFAIAQRLAASGAHVVLVDWNRRGVPGAAVAALAPTPGINDLIKGTAGFGDIVRRLPGTSVHAIACGSALLEGRDAVDPNVLNLVLDALDEAYDHIVIAGAHREARFLFEVILGRVDAGITVEDGAGALSAFDEPAGTFLGLPVADIDIIRFKRMAGASGETPPPLGRLGLRERLAAAS